MIRQVAISIHQLYKIMTVYSRMSTKRSRLLVKHGNVVHKFIWCNEDRDGGVYLGFSSFGTIIKGDMKMLRNTNQVTVKYDELQPFDAGHTNAKFSLHADGNVHMKTGKSTTRKTALFAYNRLRQIRNHSHFECDSLLSP